MARVLLVNSPNRFSEPPRHYPYGLAIITAVLEKDGCEVDCFDGNFGDLEQLDALVRSRQYDLVGLSGLITTFRYQRDAARVIKRAAPNVRLVTGGGLASAIGGAMLSLIPELDVVFIGEGEHTIRQFMNQSRNALHDLPGIAFHTSGQIVETTPAPLIENLDTVPQPQLEPWDIEAYFSGGSFPLSPAVTAARRRGNIITTRGCSHHCDFCFNALGRNRLRRRSLDVVLDELSDLVCRWHVDYVSIMDESCLENRRFIEALSEEILRRKWSFRWGIAARSTSVDLALLQQIKKAGCDFIYYGFDSGSPSTLVQMDKRLTVEDNFNAFRLSVEAGIYPVPNIIIGYDNEDMANIAENYEFFWALIRYGRSLRNAAAREVFQRGFNNFGAIYIATPYPGSMLYERTKKRLPPLGDLLEKISHKDAYELTANVSLMPDDILVTEQRKMGRFVRSFKL